jgi:hypothetical protein
MTTREKTIWEQAVRVLRSNTVSATITGEHPRGAKRALAKPREQAAPQKRAA